ncbi:MAG: oligosaccharide flippase family protein [Lachnospiraceae bacterium]|nr:oligosaccharide flippase family protein [Lachnospiraceae bacterium]
MKNSLFKNSIFNIIYTLSNIIFPFLTSIYVSRILLPYGVGKVAVAQNLASYFVAIAAFGLPAYGVREFAKVREKKEEKNKVFTELFLINIISTTVAVIIYIAIVMLNNGFNGEWKLYIICSLSIFFNYINIDWIYKGLEEYGYITVRSLIVKVISFAALLVFVKTKDDYITYALIICLATGSNYIFNIINSRKYVHFTFKGLSVKAHLKPLMLIALIAFLSTIYNKVDVTMLNILSTEEAVGYYIYSQKTINLVITMTIAITTALLPRLSYYYENSKEEFYSLLNKGFQVLSLTTIPCCIGICLISQTAVKVLYGDAFSPAATGIVYMCPLILIKGFGDLFCYQLAFSTKNEKIIIPASTAASIINIVLNLIFIPILAQNGAVIASVLSELITNLIQYIYIKRSLKYKIDLKPLFSIGIAALGMSAAVVLLKMINLSDIGSLLISICGGALVYVIINLAFGNKIMSEIFNRVGRCLRIKHE